MPPRPSLQARESDALSLHNQEPFGVFAHLRYSLGGYRPSQTVNHTSPPCVAQRPPPPARESHKAGRKVVDEGTVKMHRVFPSHCRTLRFHRVINFAESRLETAGRSLNHSCGTAINCQGISLP